MSNHKKPAFGIIVVVAVLVIAVAVGLLADPIDDDACTNGVNEEAIVSLVEGFGSKIQAVSLQAPQDIVARSIQANYSDFVSPAFMRELINDPSKAPGRLTSSPWPDRIEILSIKKLSQNMCQVNGEIIEITSVKKGNAGIASKLPITLVVKRMDERWLIDALMGEYENSSVNTGGGADAPMGVSIKKNSLSQVDYPEYNNIPIIFENAYDFPEQYKEQFSKYITSLFTNTYIKYYEIKGFEVSNVKFSETKTIIEITFIFNMITQNYYKDPDTVGYIKEAKESGSNAYQQLYDEYNQPNDSNYDMKFTAKINNGKIDVNSIQLFGNVHPKGVEYVPIERFFPNEQ